MTFESCYNNAPTILMEGAVGERLKREYGLIFNEDVAMADLVYSEKSLVALKNIWNEYISVAAANHLPFIATTPTRRANQERVFHSKYNAHIIQDNVQFLKKSQQSSRIEMYVGGLIGCKGDAYKATEVLSVDDAKSFHSWQATLFQEAEVDFLFAGIMPALSEAIGMAKAMEETRLPYIISFMIRKNGKLIDGTTIHDAIKEIDHETERKPLCYMTNCVHPLVLKEALTYSFNNTELVKNRFHGLQANTSRLSPEELDNCVDLKASDSADLAEDMINLNEYISMKIYGGCCGTTKSHMQEIAKRLAHAIKGKGENSR